MNTHTKPPAGPEGALYRRTEEIFKAIGRLRKEARAEIERPLNFLDDTDNHMELEDDGDLEPETDEPSLGFLDRMTNQTRICEGLGSDLEDEYDGREPQADDEPSLGFLEQHGGPYGYDRYDRSCGQERLCDGKGGDLEEDPSESGIADGDGLQEQMGRRDWLSGVFG
ncbi:hypothetical protein [Bradyrhizobium sp. Ash2021]|uniref:hypothetical protein n=1 Tax=Bradyrhizobium sp. Ash2021 TaxID=2954771 RepID=UPI0028156F94|nr:hypothetical protein [Bradyrhizobium sp. Ash2021]WMT78869.1 hypothetical protein NL528_22095 [Bradyrhizobium sp. Ash2021]